MFDKLLKGMGLTIKVDPDDLKNADSTKSIPFTLVDAEPALDHDAINKDLRGGNFHITVKDFDAAVNAIISVHDRKMPIHVILHAIIIAEELKQQIFSKCDEICISPWDFAQKLWECCRSIPDEIAKMNPVDFGMIESSFRVGAIAAINLYDMIHMLFGHSANEGGIHND